jgi:pimeloyl-[acyl-carrier protein] methyl ester esterase
MSSQFPKLILLPGMDGTGNLYTNFIKALPDVFETEVLRYPADHFLSYEQLVRVIEPVASSGEPFVLVAESFSTPLAILLAATKPPTLKGVVICGIYQEPCAWLAPSPLFAFIAGYVSL